MSLRHFSVLSLACVSTLAIGLGACSSNDSSGGGGSGGSGGSSGSAGSGGAAGADGGVTIAGCDVVVSPSSDDVSAVQNALIDAKAGDTICLTKGTYKFDKIITLNGTSDVTFKGVGDTRDDVVLDFAGQSSGNDAFTVEADGFTIQDLTIKDAPGDGVKVTKSDRPTFRNVRAFYTAGSVKGNGAYALYPAESTNVLIEDCEVEGSSDAAIYLGQSTTGIVRNNKAHDCVIGLEAENSLDVDMYGNEAYGNTTGILIVNLPDLPKKICQRISVHDNYSHENDHENFGSGYAAGLPRGTGMVIMGAQGVDVANNKFENNSGPGITIVSWPTFSLLGNLTTKDATFNQYAETMYVHDNTFTGNGKNPQDAYSGAPLNFTSIEDIIWDGDADPNADPTTADARRLCIQNNGTATFRNLNGIGGILDPTQQSTDLTSQDCSFPPLPAVTLGDGG